MDIAVLGATGVVGRPLVAELLGRGHAVRAGSRAGTAVGAAAGVRVDVVTGEGLAATLAGADAVVDLAHLPSPTRRAAGGFVARATPRALAAARSARTEHVVLLSVVGIDGVPWPYYEAKAAQERRYAASGLPWSLLRTTQVHPFARQVVQAARVGPVALVPRLRTQPLDPGELAAAVADLVEAGPCGRVADLGGPQEEDLVASAP